MTIHPLSLRGAKRRSNLVFIPFREIATPPFERLGMAKAARSPLLPRLVALFQFEKNNCISKEKNINFKVEVK
jgi:hypothetical protein